MNPPHSKPAWTVDRSSRLYGIDRWGLGYFSIGQDGYLAVTVQTESGEKTISLQKVITGLAQRNLSMPVMLRIENLIRDRVVELNQSFIRAIDQCGYQNDYRSVFPIKVNQQHHVIGSIADAGSKFNHGLEAGSKPELIVALSMVSDAESLIVCNGYKDEEFIDLGLQARRMGYKCFFVIESLGELELIIQRSQKSGIEPLLGCRVKLSTKVDGHWAQNSGDRSLFGLTARQTIATVDILRSASMLNCLQMLHFHLGSQLTNIRNIRDGVREACRFYTGLVRDGAPMGFLDIGGGLAVDYDGTFSTLPHSRNYDLNEYCIDVVESVMDAMDREGVSHPTLVSESGRWTVAPMSVLLFNVLSVTNFEPLPIETDVKEDDYCQPIQNLFDALENLHVRRVQENFNDANYYLGQLREQFRSGAIELRERAFGENLYLKILNRIAFEILPQSKHVPAELASLRNRLSDVYYGNFSVFQSLPDAWAIDQIFPVMPIHRLDEEPTRHAIIADLTCDCDGKLDRFTDSEGAPIGTLRLHEFHDAEPYHIGVFLIGAYQETLGDLHNLFGDTNVASININDNGEVQFVEEIHGDRIFDVLSYVEFQPDDLLDRFQQKLDDAVTAGIISTAQREESLSLYRESMAGYTYFEA